MRTCNVCGNSLCSVKNEFNKIIKAWIDEASHSDIYHMILKWIESNKDILYDNNNVRDDIEDIYVRMNRDDDIRDIVEDFIYRERYSKLREEFK